MAARLRLHMCQRRIRRALMTAGNRFEFFRNGFAALFVAGLLCPNLFAQGPARNAPSASTGAVSPLIVSRRRGERAEHDFLDKQNIALFTASAALSAADFTMTRANLENGGRELNPVVRIWGRSTPGLALNFIGETAGGITLSYLFHRTGHHRLERAVSWFNISTSAGAVSYGLSQRRPF
jgi:hypothetical protein